MIRVILLLGIAIAASMVYIYYRHQPSSDQEQFREYVLIEFASRLEGDYHKFPKQHW